ncbi:MAG: sugar phosphate nucleotidyltransferase [Candidatus Moranbacteria bacterium]|nr:sugar phosphate nucleotidyltransferase [Candidatus Moranbacteria bacterium]
MTKRKKKMKGIILAGGNATRLYPNTAQVSKHLLPVYKAPMIFYPLNILIKAGIRDILVIVSPAHSGRFLNLLEPMFRDYGVRILSTVQEIPSGLPEAFKLGEGFIGNDDVTLILGDNIFEDTETISEAIKNFESGGHVFAKKVSDPERFGVVSFDEAGTVKSIVEKPEKPESNFAVTGAYIYDNRVVDEAANLKPSSRGELEIVDLHNFYLKKGELKMSIIEGAWVDAGTEDSYLDVCILAREKELYENFDPIIKEAIEKGRERFKAMSKKMLK